MRRRERADPGTHKQTHILREFDYMRRGASSRAFSRWRMRCAQPIRLSYLPGLVEGSIFSRPGVLLTVPSEIFGEGQVKAIQDHLTTALFWAINKFTFLLLILTSVPVQISHPYFFKCLLESALVSPSERSTSGRLAYLYQAQGLLAHCPIFQLSAWSCRSEPLFNPI